MSAPASLKDEPGQAATEQGESTGEPRYATTKELVAIIPALILSVLLVALDRTILATAIPRITDDFDSLGDVAWYISSYLLTIGPFMLLFGRIYTFYDPKWVLISSIAIFEIGSAVCGAAPNSTALIVGRSVAGLGASGVTVGALTIVIFSIPLHKRPLFQGLFGAVFGVSSVIGPLLGGAFTTHVSWRWCFYINLPVGGVVVAILAVILRLDIPNRETLTWKQKLLRLDPLGTSVLLPGIVCLLLALQWGGSTYDWSNWRIILLFVLFGLLMMVFVFIQWKWPDTASVPLHIVKNRNIAAGMWYVTCVGSVMMVEITYMPLWFQAIKGSSAVTSGIQNIPSLLSLVAGSILAGALVQRLGYYVPFMYSCTVISSVGAALITTWKVDTGSGRWIGYQIIWGFGLGLGMQQSILAAQTCLKMKDAPTGVSLMFFAQTVGGAIFTPVAQSVFANALVDGLSSHTNVHIRPEAVVNAGATEIRGLVSSSDLPAILEVYNEAVVNAFYVGLGLSCASALSVLFFEWKSVKKAKPDAKDTADSEGGVKGASKDTDLGSISEKEKTGGATEDASQKDAGPK